MMKAGDGGNLHGHSTIKVPPAWDPRSEDTYPFRKWIRDLGLWAVTTDNPKTPKPHAKRKISM